LCPRFVVVQEIQCDNIPQGGVEVGHVHGLQVDTFDILPVRKDDVRLIRSGAFAGEPIVAQVESIQATAVVALAAVLAHLRTSVPVIAGVLHAAALSVRLQVQVVGTGADISLRRVVPTMRALMSAVAQLIRAQEALVRCVLAIVLSVAQLVHRHTLLGEATQPIRMLTDHRLVHVKSTSIDMGAVKLISLVETVRNAIAAQKVRDALERIQAGELMRSTFA